MNVLDALLKELEGLPEDRQLAVLTYVRLLKIGLAAPLDQHVRYDDLVDCLNEKAEVERQTS